MDTKILILRLSALVLRALPQFLVDGVVLQSEHMPNSQEPTFYF